MLHSWLPQVRPCKPWVKCSGLLCPDDRWGQRLMSLTWFLPGLSPCCAHYLPGNFKALLGPRAAFQMPPTCSEAPSLSSCRPGRPAYFLLLLHSSHIFYSLMCPALKMDYEMEWVSPTSSKITSKFPFIFSLFFPNHYRQTGRGEPKFQEWEAENLKILQPSFRAGSWSVVLDFPPKCSVFYLKLRYGRWG